MIKARHSDKSLVVDILSKAFDQNISVNYVIKQHSNEIIRRRRIEKLMEYSFDDCFRHGEVFISDDRSASALVLYPDNKKMNLRSLVADVKVTFSSIGASRVLKVLKRESKVKEYHPKVPLLYLRFIGVHPNHQGKGIGKSLLQEIVELGRQQNRPIVLETSMTENVPFYKGVGFELFQELELPHKLFLFKK